MRTAISTIAFAAAGDGAPSLGEALADANEAAHVVADAAEADAAQTVAAVVENAQDQIEEAQEAAAAIARAAMETELGRQIGALSTRVEEAWQELASLRLLSSEQAATISELSAQLAATAAVTMTTALDQASNSSTPLSLDQAPLETKVEEAIGQVAEILPGTVNAQSENTPVAVARARKVKRFL